MAKSEGPTLTPIVRTFLETPRLARLCTIGKDGYPHVVPLFFALEGDEIIFGTDRDEPKVRNALRNPKAAVVIGGDPDSDDAGYMIQGDLSVDSNPQQATVRGLLSRYEPEREVNRLLAEWDSSKTVLLRLKPRRVIRVW